jgi:hypothetical protein
VQVDEQFETNARKLYPYKSFNEISKEINKIFETMLFGSTIDVQPRKIRKRGSITDLPYIMAGIFSFIFVAILVTYIVSSFNTQIQSNSLMPASAKSASSTMSNSFPQVIDGSILFLFFGMVIISIVLASFISVHPVFIIFYIFELILLVYVGAGIADAYQVVIETPALAAVAAKYTTATFFFRYFPYFIGLSGAALAMVMHKTRGNW